MEKAAYMVLGLGDVYLGAPCAVPVDPRWASSPPAALCQCIVSLSSAHAGFL